MGVRDGEREREVEKKGKWRKKNTRLSDPLRFLFEFILPMPTSYYRKGNIFNGVPISMHLFYSMKICFTWWHISTFNFIRNHDSLLKSAEYLSKTPLYTIHYTLPQNADQLLRIIIIFFIFKLFLSVVLTWIARYCTFHVYKIPYRIDLKRKRKKKR